MRSSAAAAASIVLSVAFATLIMYFVRRSRGGSLTDPDACPLDR